VRCGDRTTIIEPIKQASWVKIRTVDGKIGYISWATLSMQASDEPEKQNLSAEADKQLANKKQEKVQKAADDLEDCRLRAQNEYDKKINIVGTLTLTPVQRVYASTRLKQNLDTENKNCRSQYESSLRALSEQ
jgi:hypothetical protein